MTPRPRTRTRAMTAAISVGLVAAAIVAVIIVERGRRQEPANARTPSAPPNGSGMANMPGMSGMAANSSSAITISPAQQQALGITFGVVEKRPLVADTRAPGVVTVDETRITQVAARVNGFAERLAVNETGQPVTRGASLLEIYSPDVVAAEHELLLAEHLQRTVGQTTVPGVPPSADLVAAARQRLQAWDVAPQQIDDVLRTHQVRRTFRLYAPASGVVMTKNLVQGQAVTAGESLYTIANLDDVWIDVEFREADAASVRVGARADISITGIPGKRFGGRLAYIYPTLDTTARAVRARIVVSNSEHLLKPGMYATIRLRTASRQALTVPNSAILRTGARNIVFVDLGGGRLRPTDIEIGQTTGDLTEVLAGLDAGQRVATSAQFLLDSEANLGEVMRSMISQMPASSPSGSR